MRALRFDGTLTLDREAPIPRPDRGRALIRVRRAGICGTDLEIMRGYKRFKGILGHEFAGQVVECDDPQWLGRRVCSEINVTCGICDLCQSGISSHCRQRTVVGILGQPGAFADYIALPVANLHTLPDEIDDDTAVFVEPVAAAFEILEQVEIRPRDRIVVVGDGRLGNLCAQVLATTGARVLVVGRHPRKLDTLARLGIETSLAGEPLPEAEIVVEASGSSGGLDTALELVRPRGTLVLKSTLASPVPASLNAVVVKEITVVGSRCGPFTPAIQALRDGQIHVSPLIDCCYELGEAPAAMEHAARPGILKILIAMTP